MDSDLTTTLGQRCPARLGVVTLAKPFKDLDTIRRREREMLTALRGLGVSPIVGEQLVMDEASLAAVLRQLTDVGAQSLLVVLGSYSSDAILLELARALPMPLILWAPPEVLSPEAFPPFASLVGMTQNIGTLQRCGYRPYPLYGEADAPAIVETIARLIRAFSAVQMLRQARVGRIGPGCPGMFDTHFDEARLQRQLGIEVVDVPIQVFIDLYQTVPEADVAGLAGQVKEMGVARALSEQDYLRSLRAYAALRTLVEKHSLTAVTVRCWPELKAQQVVSPCLALSLLADQGIPAACEGDACGAISMLVAQLLTDRPAFFGDLVAVDEATDEVQMFHCGAGATGLGEPGQAITLRTHSRPVMWTPGVTVEFPVGPGPATYLRFGEIDGAFRLLMTEGRAVRHTPFCRGTTLRFKPVAGGRAWLGGLLAAGAEHHQVVAQGEVMTEATVLCDLWGVVPQRVP